MPLNDSIGSRIAKLRKEHNLTQEQLAEKLDISIKHCSAVERGTSRLSLDYLIEISNMFDVSLDYLIKGTSLNCTSSSDIIPLLPNTIVNILISGSESEIKLLQEYLRMYTKIRSNT